MQISLYPNKKEPDYFLNNQVQLRSYDIENLQTFNLQPVLEQETLTQKGLDSQL
jgi:hypothetical protein